jgi:hypothetical protein
LARTLTAILLALALLAAACGDEDNPASKAFGGLSEADQQELEEWFTAMEDFPHVNARFARMLQEENARGAQAAVDDMTGILDKGESIARGFESGELKSTTEDYVSTMQDLAGSYETLLQVARRDPSGKGDATKEVLVHPRRTSGRRRARTRGSRASCGPPCRPSSAGSSPTRWRT